MMLSGVARVSSCHPLALPGPDVGSSFISTGSVRIDDHGAICERLRTNGRHGEDVALRADNWSAGGQRICRGTCRRGDDQAVTTIAGQPPLSDSAEMPIRCGLSPRTIRASFNAHAVTGYFCPFNFQCQCGPLADDESAFRIRLISCRHGRPEST